MNISLNGFLVAISIYLINVHNKTFNKGTEETQSKKKAEIKQQQQPMQEIKNIEINNSKKTYPKDPEFLNDNMILIKQSYLYLQYQANFVY